MKENTSTVKDTINSILEAEQKADQLLENASVLSKKIAKDSISKSDKIKEKVILDFRETRKKQCLEAEKQAEVEYNKKIADGVKYADDMISAVKNKVEKIVSEQIKNILG